MADVHSPSSIFEEPYQGGNLLHNLLLFGRVCKSLGLDISPYRMTEVARAIEWIELANKADFYHTLRAMLVTHQRDLNAFDEAFNLFWQRPTEGWTQLSMPVASSKPTTRRTQILPPNALLSAQAEDDPASEQPPTLINVVPTYSQQENLRYKDFAGMTGEELALARKAMATLPATLSLRRIRRSQRGKGQKIDSRQLLRRNLRYAGEVFEIPTLTPRYKPRPIVLICDISGSMERYTRIFLQFMHIFANTEHKVESFVFSVHLTRITRQIRHKSVDRALKEIGANVNDWGNGTRTGEALRIFNYDWSRRVLGRGAIVLLITDGWDRGDPEILRHEMARLQRSCHRLVWLNPLLDMPEYEPLTRGAQAMLPYVDDFLPLRNLANLEMVIQALQKLNWERKN